MSIFRNHLLKMCRTNFIVSIGQSLAGDICLYDKINSQMIIVRGNFKISDFPLEKYTPVGIVVVPGIHSIYGENTCAVISLVEMSCDTPETGVNTEYLLCFSPQVDLSYKNYNVVIINDGTLKTNGFGYLSKNGVYNSSTLKIPDPYNDDMTRNPDYYNTSVSQYNAMSDFAGRNNTSIIISTRGTKNYETWKPVRTTGSDYPAASCCNMFFTEGTTQGQWYLPAAGEWGYVTSKWDDINKSLSLLNKLYDNRYLVLANNASYWTSTEHNAKNTRYVHTDNGMGNIAKTSTIRARAFTIITE